MNNYLESGNFPTENRVFTDYDDIYDEYDRETAQLREQLLELNRPVQEVLVDNFRGSFKHSNGSSVLQFLFYVQIADLLNTQHDTTAIDEATNLQSYPGKILIPRRHRQPRLHPYTKFEDRTDSIWQTCMNIVKHRHDLDSLEDTKELSGKHLEMFKIAADPTAIHIAIPLYMIKGDLTYLNNGRPGRTDDAAKYRSHVRDYCIVEKPTGTPELDYTMQETGVLIKAVANPNRIVHEDDGDLFTLSQSVMELVDTWEEIHQEPFFPEGTFSK